MTQGGYPGDQQQGAYGAPPGGGYNAPQGGSYGAPQGANYGAPQGGYNQAPAYGQGGYGGPSQGGYGAPPSYGAPSRGSSIGAVGLGLTLLGLIAVVVGMFALNWASEGADSTFTDIADVIDKAPDGRVLDFPTLYFGWLGWALLIGAAVVAILANLPTPAASALRPLGLLIGIGAAVATLFAIKLVSSQSLAHNIKETGPGYWTVIAGFVVVGIGAAIGPKRN